MNGKPVCAVIDGNLLLELTRLAMIHCRPLVPVDWSVCQLAATPLTSHALARYDNFARALRSEGRDKVNVVM